MAFGYSPKARKLQCWLVCRFYGASDEEITSKGADVTPEAVEALASDALGKSFFQLAYVLLISPVKSPLLDSLAGHEPSGSQDRKSVV